MLHRLRMLGAAALAAVALSACSAETPSASPGAPSNPDPGVAHDHGLGVDPADGVLYAATQYGLFRIPETGPATRVADRFQDTMRFTVVGPNTFLGSGHPDFQKDPNLPPRLGLIRSTDAAETWENVSLSVKVDFHALHAAHNKVYGWDSGSGNLMVSSDDGRTWDTRSTLALRDCAVSPADADLLLATTEKCLARSTDAGRTWQLVPGAPVLVVLAWGDAGSLFGVAPDGSVAHSNDGGSTWTARGKVGGQPEAVAVDSRSATNTLFVAAADRGIVASTDRGTTFSSRTPSSPRRTPLLPP